tara:strand:- start:818 stop:1951 length:1134 start_codon:yes stop_codon:yes gene_type:complete
MLEKLKKTNFKLILLGIFFVFVFLYDFDNGATDYFFLIISSVLFIGAFLLKKEIAEYLFIVIFVSYFFLFFYALFHTPFNGGHDHNIFEEDIFNGYKLKVNLNTVFDDNIRSGQIVTNSEGFRDDEFIKSGKNTLTLLGDSMVFGLKVDQVNNIDKQIENICEVDAYNFGVGGYGIPDVYRVFANTDHDTSHVIYFFYMNDLREDNLYTSENILVYDGYLITKTHSGLKERSEVDIESEINSIQNKKYIYSPLKLRYFFMLFKNYLINKNVYTAPEEMLSGYSNENTELAVEWTIKLSEIVKKRKAKFIVFVLPSLKSVMSRKYLDEVNNYMKLVKQENIEVIDIFDDMTVEDYISYDGHLSENGMQKIAIKLCNFI